MATTTDVKLLGDQIRIEGRRQVIVEALDLCVDSPDRRSEHTTPDRRAIVHDHQDGLTINYDFDYPGGVTVNGLKIVNVRGKKLISLLTILGNTKIAGNLQVDNLHVEGRVDGDLAVAGKILFHGRSDPGVSVPIHPGQPPSPPAPPLDLAQVVFQLQQDVAALKKKVGI